jgi:hypothetical protein
VLPVPIPLTAPDAPIPMDRARKRRRRRTASTRRSVSAFPEVVSGPGTVPPPPEVDHLERLLDPVYPLNPAPPPEMA